MSRAPRNVDFIRPESSIAFREITESVELPKPKKQIPLSTRRLFERGLIPHAEAEQTGLGNHDSIVDTKSERKPSANHGSD